MLKKEVKMNINSFGGITLEEIRKFENIIAFSLPKDYKQFLIEYNGGTAKIRYSTFKVEELNEDIPLDVLYGIGVKEKQLDLLKVNEEFLDDMLPNCIIIGEDPGAGMVVLMNDDDLKGVYYWDHSLFFAKSNEEKNIYKVADSFEEFISGLKNPSL